MHHCPDRPIQLRLLGEFDISVANANGCSIRYLKPRLLLAMLALAQGKPHTRTELADVLWPHDLKDGRVNLRHALFVLRQLLEPVPGVWLSAGKTLALNPDLIMVDVLAVLAAPGYEALPVMQRLSYDQGRFLEYAELPESHAFTAWKANWQSRVDREMAQCRSVILADLQASGHQSQALETAKQWVHLRPEDETAHRQLIELLLNRNEHESARLAYQHCVNMMRQYFDTEPSAQLRDLVERDSLIVPTREADAEFISQNRPLGVLAIVLSIDDVDAHADDILHDLQAIRERVQDLARREGGHVLVGADESLAIVYGYPQLCERPAHFAAELGRAILTLSVPSAIRIGMGVHAGIVLAHSAHRPDAGALLSQHATRLAYLAESGEILLSMPAYTRLADQYAVRSEKRHGTSLLVLESILESKAVSRMFGRVREFDTLVRLWARLPIAQTPTAMVVRGEAGIGKSLLIRVMSEYVRHTGGVICTLHSDERHRHIPFYPVLEWVTQKLALRPDGDKGLYESPDHQTQLTNAIRKYLAPDASVLPELQRRLFPGRERHGLRQARGDATSLELTRALVDILTHRTDRKCPLLLVWEDAYAADASSLMVLDTLMRHVQPGPTMVLLSTRDEFVCAGRTRELLLKPLEPQGVAELVAHRLKGERSSTKLRARIVNESGGVPLYAEEMLRQAARGVEAGVTPLMTDLAAVRLSRLSHAARNAVQFAAVAGDIDIALMLRASKKMDWNADDLPKILDELRQHGLISDQIPADFCYPLIRDAIYHSLSPGQRRRHHAHVAQCLIEGAEPSASTSIAMHLEMAQHGESGGVRIGDYVVVSP